MEVNIIELWPIIIECALCGDIAKLEYSVLMFEGKIVDETKTDEWAGMPICRSCYLKDGLEKGYILSKNMNKKDATNCRIGDTVIAKNGPYTQIGIIINKESHSNGGYWITYEWCIHGLKKSATKMHQSLAIPILTNLDKKSDNMQSRLTTS